MNDLITADLHLSDNPRDEHRWGVFKELAKVAARHNADRLIILGDLTEAKDHHGSKLVNRFVNELTDLNNMGLSIVILRGNHDGQTTDCPYFQFVDRMGAIWIQEPTVIGLKGGVASDLFLPYSDDPVKEWKGLWKYAKYRYIFCHQYFKGAKVESGYESDKGIDTSIFPKGFRVISGDIHSPQRLGPVTYVGAPYQVDFGDDYDPRFLLIDNDKLLTISSELPGKKLLTYNRTKHVVDGIGTCYSGDIVKIRVELGADDYPNWHNISQEWRKWAENEGYLVHQIEPIIEAVRIKKVAMKQLNRSDKDILNSYAKARGTPKLTLIEGGRLL